MLAPNKTIVFSLARKIFIATASVAVVTAQSSSPGPLFQYSALTGSGNTITATRVPINTSSGQVVYQDIVIQFDNDGNGNLTVTAGYPDHVDIAKFAGIFVCAGNYVGPSNVAKGNGLVTINGPGVVAGGSTTWSLLTASGADSCTYPASATWYVGPIQNNPLATRLQKVGITSTAWYYGIAGGGIAFSCGGSLSFAWGAGAIIGVSQVGNTITFASFTNNSFDQASPVDQITYTLSQ